MTAALRALEVKLAEAKAPSRELDAAIDDWLCERKLGWPAGKAASLRDKHYISEHIKPVTSSLDAAVAFAEAMLPEHYWQLNKPVLSRAATIWNSEFKVVGTAQADNVALALCLAVIRAFLAKETG